MKTKSIIAMTIACLVSIYSNSSVAKEKKEIKTSVSNQYINGNLVTEYCEESSCKVMQLDLDKIKDELQDKLQQNANALKSPEKIIRLFEDARKGSSVRRTPDGERYFIYNSLGRKNMVYLEELSSGEHINLKTVIVFEQAKLTEWIESIESKDELSKELIRYLAKR